MNEISLKQKVLNILNTVMDPEIPVLSIIDLGIVREIKNEGKNIHIIITPTYSGCPATEVIQFSIKMALMAENIDNFKIINQLSPAWTTLWMSEKAKKKLKEYGISPPISHHGETQNTVPCPQCNSNETVLISEFSSTACKALYKCKNCFEPFDYFKCH